MKPKRPKPPRHVQLRLRKEAGFGCCKCGRPVYEYHHIIEYANDPHFRSEDMMILCPYCHDEATKGAMTEKEQRVHKANLYNIQRGLASGQFKINQDLCAIECSTILMRANGTMFRVDGEPLLGLELNSNGGLDLSVILFDKDNNKIATIDHNEWVTESDFMPWDIESDFQYLKIRQKAGDIRLEIDARTEPVQLRADLWAKGHLIKIGPSELFFKSAMFVFQNFIIQDACFNINSKTGSFQLVHVTSFQQGTDMSTLLLHKNTVFEDQVIFLADNAYIECTFKRCTFMFRETPSILDRCTFDSCVWHLDLLVSDRQAWARFVQNIVPMIGQSLPQTPETAIGEAPLSSENS